MANWEEKVEYVVAQAIKMDLPLSEVFEIIDVTVIRSVDGTFANYVPKNIFTILAKIAQSTEDRLEAETQS